MEALKCIRFDLPVLFLKSLSNGNLGIVDAQNTLRIIDTSSYEIVDGFKTNIKHERIIGTYVDVTPDGEYSVSAVLGTNQAAIFSLSKREFLYRVGRHHGEVESVGIDPNGRYFVTGGEDGKSFAWVLGTSRFAFSLPSHADAVSTVAFDDKGQWIATGSYDHTIALFNISTMKQSVKLRGHKSPIVKIIFLPSAKILSVAQNGEMIVWDMRNGKVIKRLQSMSDNVTSMCISTLKQFVFVGTEHGHVGLYDMQIMEQISSRYIKESEIITSLAYISGSNCLAVATVSGNTRIYPLLGEEEKYMRMLSNRDYKTYYNLLEDNPMLFYTKSYDAAERIWLNLVEKGRKHLENNERQAAMDIFAPFAGVPKKHALLSQLLTSYEKYDLFHSHIEAGKFSLAYSLSKQYPAFKETELYRKMELQWKKVFFKAQELILTPNGEEQARELLAPYRGISDKTVHIQQLFEQRRMYEFFRNVVAKQEYVKFFGLVNMYPFLREFDEYSTVMEYADKLYIQSQKAYASEDYALARKACEILISFPDYAAEAQEMADTIRIKHLFYEAISSGNLANAFSYLSSYPLLYETPEAQKLERQWNNTVDKTQHLAAEGKAHEMLAVFKPYFGIRDKFVAMAGVMSQAYCVQLEQKIRYDADREMIERGIRRYVLVFGIDEGIKDILDFFKRISQSKLDLELLKQGSLESWTPSMRIDDITARA
jgi:hypothetical protein